MLNIHIRKHCLPFLLSVLAASHSLAQSLPLDTAVRTGKLPNGFTYYIRHNTEPKNRVVLYLANKIGSLQEDDKQRGLAHFMEHMSFNGTKHYPKNELVDYLQKSGVRFGADLNAYTSFEETVYQLPLPSDDTSILRNGLQIMRDWAAEATLETTEIDKERGVVLEEKRLHNGAGQRMQDSSFSLQVNGARYASRSPIGTEAILKNFSPATLRTFYKDWYRPDQQALIIVGDVDVNSMEQQIKKLFSDLKGPAIKRPVLKYAIRLTGRNQYKFLTDPEETVTRISVTIKQPALPLRTKADYRNQIIRNLYNHALAGRLRDLSAKPAPTFIQTQAGMGGFMGGLDAFQLSIVPKPGKLAEAFTDIWREIVRMQRFGLTVAELERAKTTWQTQMENTYRESNKITSSAYVQEYLQYFLKGAAAPGIAMEYQLSRELLPSIALAEVNSLAASVISDHDRDIILYAPEKERATLPAEAQVNNWISAIGKESLTIWQETNLDKGLLPALPTSGKITHRERMDSLGATIYTLSNGLKVWLKPTDFRNEEIMFSAWSEGGSSLYPDRLYLDATNAGQLIAANGAGDFSAQELNKMLTGKTLQVQPFIQERYEGISGASTPKDLETALQLTYLYFTAPRKDTLQFANIISRSKAAMANRSNNPEAVFSDSVAVTLGQHHYRRQPITIAKLDSIRLDSMYTIYRQRFANAADFTFAFTGNIDTATFLPLMAQYLGSLPANGMQERARDIGVRMPSGIVNKTIYKGKDNKATVRLIWHGDYAFSDTSNMQLSALGALLQYRITDRIRELEGGAYTPQAGVSYGRQPESHYAFSIAFTCAPASVE
jgi:zinc protease